MMSKNLFLTAAALLLLLGGCRSAKEAAVDNGGPVDRQATAETRALLKNLKALAPDHILFGHQDDLAYGTTWWAEAGRSDVKEVSGSYPAVYGWDLGGIELGNALNLDSVRFSDMRQWIQESYRRGGVNTLSWHLANPVTGGGAWDTTLAVSRVLPGGDANDTYRHYMDRLAAFVASLKDDSGRPIPVIFRPYHEQTGFWFWWGIRHRSIEEYQQLYRYTVAYLRDEKGLHNLLYAYAPNAADNPNYGAYMDGYPGDDFIDIFGYDDYYTLRTKTPEALTEKLAWIAGEAEKRGKVAAFTETGHEGLPDANYWTSRLLAAIEADPMARRMAYVLVWRNAPSSTHAGHFYAPYPGQASAADFIRFRNSDFVLFEDEMPNMYR